MASAIDLTKSESIYTIIISDSTAALDKADAVDTATSSPSPVDRTDGAPATDKDNVGGVDVDNSSDSAKNPFRSPAYKKQCPTSRSAPNPAVTPTRLFGSGTPLVDMRGTIYTSYRPGITVTPVRARTAAPSASGAGSSNYGLVGTAAMQSLRQLGGQMGSQAIGPGGKFYGSRDEELAIPHFHGVLNNPRAGLRLDVLAVATKRSEGGLRKAFVESPHLSQKVKDLYSEANDLTKSAADWPALSDRASLRAQIEREFSAEVTDKDVQGLCKALKNHLDMRSHLLLVAAHYRCTCGATLVVRNQKPEARQWSPDHNANFWLGCSTNRGSTGACSNSYQVAHLATAVAFDVLN